MKKKLIVKQLQVLIQVCSKYQTKENAEYLNMLKSELQFALDTVEGERQDFEFLADTEYYNELVA